MLDVTIATRHTDIPPGVRRVAEEKLNRLTRYLDGFHRADICFVEEHNPRIHDGRVCEVALHNRGRVVRARAAGPDMVTAIDRVVEKLEHRLERLKGRLVERSQPRRAAQVD